MSDEAPAPAAAPEVALETPHVDEASAVSPLKDAGLPHVLKVALWRGGITGAFLVVAMTAVPLVLYGWWEWWHLAFALQAWFPVGLLVVGVTAPLEAIAARREWSGLRSFLIVFAGVLASVALGMAQLLYAESIWSQGAAGAMQAVFEAAERNLRPGRVISSIFLGLGVTLPVLIRLGRISGKVGPGFGCLSTLGVLGAFFLLQGNITKTMALLALPILILPLGLALVGLFALCDRLASGGRLAQAPTVDPNTLPPLRAVDRVLLRCVRPISPGTALALIVGLSIYEFAGSRSWAIGLGVVTWLGITITASNLAAIHTRAGRFERGLAVALHQLAAPRVELGAQHPTKDLHACEVRCLLGLGRLAEARRRVGEAFGEDDHSTIACERRVKLIEAFLAAGDLATARELSAAMPLEGMFALNHRLQVARAFLIAGAWSEGVELLEQVPADGWGLQRKSRDALLAAAEELGRSPPGA